MPWQTFPFAAVLLYGASRALVPSASGTEVYSLWELYCRESVRPAPSFCATATVLSDGRRRVKGEIEFLTEISLPGLTSTVCLAKTPDVPWNGLASLQPGDGLTGLFILKPPQESDNLNIFSFSEHMRRRGITCEVDTRNLSPERRTTGKTPACHAYVEDLRRRYPGSEAVGVVLAATLGIDEFLSKDVKQTFKSSSTMHMVVVSGFHLGIVCLLAGTLAHWTLGQIVPLISRVPRSYLTTMAALMFSLVYTYITGCELSTVRSAVVIAFCASFRARGIPSPTLRALAASAVAVTIIWPLSFLEPSFQLTFAATGGVLYAVGTTPEQIVLTSLGTTGVHSVRHLAEKTRRAVKAAIRVNYFAWLFSSPVVILWFGNFFLAAPVVNLVITPLFSLICILGAGLALAADALHVAGSHTALAFVLGSTDAIVLSLERITHALPFPFSPVTLDDWRQRLTLTAAILTVTAAHLALYSRKLRLIFRKLGKVPQYRPDEDSSEFRAWTTAAAPPEALV